MHMFVTFLCVGKFVCLCGCRCETVYVNFCVCESLSYVCVGVRLCLCVLSPHLSGYETVCVFGEEVCLCVEVCVFVSMCLCG